MDATAAFSVSPDVTKQLLERGRSMQRSALRWLGVKHEHFEPYDRNGALKLDSARIKAFAELLITSLALRTPAGANPTATGLEDLPAGANPTATGLEDLLLTYLGDDRLTETLLRPGYPLVQSLHLAVGRHVLAPGQRHQRRVLHARLAYTDIQAELHRHSLIEARMCMDWLGLDCPTLAPMNTLLGHSVLARRPSLITISEDDLYELTHVLMFGTRYGSVPLAYELSPWWTRAIETLTLVLVQERHWDLVGEMLLSWDAVGAPRTEAFFEAWLAFFDSQMNDGSFPPPRPSSRPEAEDPGSFQSSYHTVLVSIIASHVARRRTRT